MNEKLLLASKSILLLCIAGTISIVSYLLFTNPELNFVLSKKINTDMELNKAKIAKDLQQWQLFQFTDVNAISENYPLVVLQSGFKVIKVYDDEALVGWKVDVLNTSQNNSYKVDINYSITDEDSFIVTTSTESEWVKPEEFSTIKSTIKVNVSNLDRLKDDTWYISAPDWEDKEKNVKTKRYERLAKIIVDDNKRPYWIDKIIEDKESFLLIVSDKWKVINTAILKSKENKTKKANETLNTDQL